VTARAFADGVRTLLGSESTFVAAMTTLLGRPLTGVQRSNVPLSNIPAGNLPCAVIEQGDGVAQSISNDGADEGLVIGLSQQQFASDLHVAIVWSEQDRDTAADQRADLPTLFAQLFMRNPTPGGIAFAMLREWEPDRGVSHPLQVWRATLVGEYAVPNT
jgi:hypothetical protein